MERNQRVSIRLAGDPVHLLPDCLYWITYPLENPLISYVKNGILVRNDRFQKWKPLTIYIGNYETLDSMQNSLKGSKDLISNNPGQFAYFSDIKQDQLLEFIRQKLVKDNITTVIIYGIHNVLFNNKDIANLMTDVDCFITDMRKLQNEFIFTGILLSSTHPRYGDENHCILTINKEGPVEINAEFISNLKLVFSIGFGKLFEIPKANPRPTKIFPG